LGAGEEQVETDERREKAYSRAGNSATQAVHEISLAEQLPTFRMGPRFEMASIKTPLLTLATLSTALGLVAGHGDET
jgi:hypothetical protein